MGFNHERSSHYEVQNGTEEVSIYLPYEMKNIAFMEEIGNMDKKNAFMEESDGPINIF